MNPRKEMRDTMLVGVLPPIYTGTSMAFQTLVEGFEERGLPHQIVDISSQIEDRKEGRWSWRRVLEYVQILLRYSYKVFGCGKNVYILIAQSRVGFFRDMAMIWFARCWGHRILVHMHGGNYAGFYNAQSLWLKWLIRKTLRCVDTIIVLGEDLRKMYDFDPALKERIRVVHNGLPLQLDDMPASAKEIKKGEPVRLLYLSNLIESKGYLDVLEAVRILVNGYGLNVNCRFCGLFLCHPTDDVHVESTEHAERLFMDFASEHDLSNFIEYVGVVSGKEKEDELKTAHFFILPTSYDNEGQPVSMIEAMAYGCVLISTRYRAIPDMLIEGKNGYFVEARKPEQIAQTIINASQNPDKFRQMSSYSIEHFGRYFRREAHLNRIIPIITGNF